MLQPRNFPETRPSMVAALGTDGPIPSAWRQFFDHYAPAVYRIALRHGLADADADDIVQQTMVLVARHISKFEYDKDRGYFRNWVRRIAENKIAEFFRRRRNVVTLPDCNQMADDRPGPEEAWEREWHMQDMLWCLEQVAADCAPRRIQAFRMYALEGVSANETARRLEMTVSNVYVTRHLVLNMIRERMRKLNDV